MDRLTNHIVATKRERHIADTAADQDMRQSCLDLTRRLNEIAPITGVFLDARCDGENVRIENYVGRVHSDLLGQNFVRTFADVDLALGRVGLPGFIERHNDDRGTVVTY